MANKNSPPKQVKVEVRPASNILKILLIVLIIFSIVALAALRWVHSGILSEIDEMKQEVKDRYQFSAYILQENYYQDVEEARSNQTTP